MTMPISSNGLHQQVYQTLADYLRCDSSTLHPEDSLRDDLGLDSLQTIELVYQVESAFDIQIPDEDFGQLRTIGDVVTYLGKRTNSQPQPVSSRAGSNANARATTHSTPQPKSRSRSKTSHS